MNSLILYDTCLFYTPPPIFIHFTGKFQVTNMYLQAEWKLENSVDSDQLASQKPAGLDCHCF